MHDELWDFESRNRIASYTSKKDALEFVRALLATGTPESHEALALLHDEADYLDAEIVAAGRELVDLAVRAAESDHRRLTA